MKIYPPVTAAVLAYIREQYGAEPEYLWEDNDTSAAIRHPTHKKWFAALLQDLPGSKLGLPELARVDVLNVKCDPVLIASLRDGVGYLPAWHMNKTHWLSIRLDGAVPAEDICSLVDLSWQLTAPRKCVKKKNFTE